MSAADTFPKDWNLSWTAVSSSISIKDCRVSLKDHNLSLSLSFKDHSLSLSRIAAYAYSFAMSLLLKQPIHPNPSLTYSMPPTIYLNFSSCSFQSLLLFIYSSQLPFLTHSIPAIFILFIFPIYSNLSLLHTSQPSFHSRFSMPARGECVSLLSLSCFPMFLPTLSKGVFPCLWCLWLAHKWLRHCHH